MKSLINYAFHSNSQSNEANEQVFICVFHERLINRVRINMINANQAPVPPAHHGGPMLGHD